jgi:hypothetical protein
MLDYIPKACSLNASTLFVYRYCAFAYSPSYILLYSVFKYHIVFDIHIGIVSPIYYYLCTLSYRNILAVYLKVVD